MRYHRHSELLQKLITLTDKGLLKWGRSSNSDSDFGVDILGGRVEIRSTGMSIYRGDNSLLSYYSNVGSTPDFTQNVAHLYAKARYSALEGDGVLDTMLNFLESLDESQS